MRFSFQGVTYEYERPDFASLKAFKYGVDRAAMVYGFLESAKNSFEGGHATYENATERIKTLISESNVAARELVDACHKVKRWFPDLDLEDFDGRANDLIAFCRAWVEAQAHPKEVRKNSSRARSGKSPGPRPTIAGTVNGSLPGREGNGRESALSPASESQSRIAPDALGS
jgi:hypothetical protein